VLGRRRPADLWAIDPEHRPIRGGAHTTYLQAIRQQRVSDAPWVVMEGRMGLRPMYRRRCSSLSP